MEYIKVLLTAVSSIMVLFILTKIMGRKQVSQLSMFDYINGITIGSIAAEMATSLEDFIKPLIALIVYAILTLAISYASCKSYKLRRFFIGRPLIVYDNKKIYNKNLLKAKIDIGEFLAECRTNGYFKLSDLQTVIYEPNGKMSFIPIETKRPTNPSDLGITPSQEKQPITLIVDGRIIDENLKQSGKDKNWIDKQLDDKGLSIDDIFYGYCDENNSLFTFSKNKIKLDKHVFE